MSFINPQTKEINCKLVYYGPPFAGKSTNLAQIYQQVGAKGGPPPSLTDENNRTLYFDFLPLELGTVKDYKLRLHLYTVPGQVVYANSRKLILKGVDGVVFVADSQLHRLEEDRDSLKELQRLLKEHEIDPEKLPLVFQYNKRDLAPDVPVAELRRLLNPRGAPDFEATAVQGRGVMEPLLAVARRVIKTLGAS